MQILYLAHRLPFPPNKGDKLRAFRHVRQLAKSHRVWCACFVDCPADFDYVAALRTYCEDVIAVPLSRSRGILRGAMSLLAGRTVTEGIYSSRRMRRSLRDLANSIRFDVVAAFSSSMAAYAQEFPAARRVIDLCDLDSRKWAAYASWSRAPLRQVYAAESRRLARVERQCLERFDAVAVISPAEAAPLQAQGPCDRLHIVTNGVDAPSTPRTAAAFERTGRIVGFLGVMNYRPNVDAVRWFVEACWPRVRQDHPSAVFRIVGRWPCRAVRRLRRIPGVVVVGEVGDVTIELDRFDVSVAPLRIACGLQNKVLEAMAASVPLVLSPQAAQCLGAMGHEDCIIGTDAEAFAEAVSRLLQDPGERHRIGEGGRAFVATRHRWDDALRAYELLATGSMVRTTGASDVATTRAGRTSAAPERIEVSSAT